MESYIGYWFLPNSPDSLISGTLDINESGVSTLLISSRFNDINESTKNDLILGNLSNGTKVTLINPHVVQGNFSLGGFMTTKYICHTIIMGEHYQSIEDIVLSEVKVNYPYLELWLNQITLQASMNDKEKIINMEYKMPKVIVQEYKGHRMEFTYDVKTGVNPFGHFNLDQDVFVRFMFKEKLDYKSAIDICHEFSQFLTLCMGEKISINSIFTKNENGRSAEILIARNENNDPIINENNILIKYTYIQDSFDNAIQIWSEKKELLEPIIVYFIEAYEKIFHEPMSFLKIVQAIEAFSRRMRDNKSMPQEEFELKVERLTSQIASEDDKKLIKGILSNEPRLRERLVAIFEEVNFVFDISKTKRKSLINSICDTRNYYTHFDDISKYQVLDTKSMYYATEYMRWTLQVLILNELNVDLELIKQSIIRNMDIYRMKEALGLLKEEETVEFKLKSLEKKHFQ